MTTATAHFRVPDELEGTIHFEDRTFQIHGGVAQIPPEMAANNGWRRALPDEIAAHQALEAQASATTTTGADNPLSKLLEGNVADVVAALEGPYEGHALTAEQLVTLAQIETAGKNRKGVLGAIAAALEAQAPSA